jgi:thiamine-monophosphate kinase
MRRGTEANLIDKIASISRGSRFVKTGIGDDAAVIDLPRGRYVVTTDTLVERIDFLPDELPFWIGRRAAAANLSDLAAMGAGPVGCLLTLGLPARRGLDYGWKIARGVTSKMAPWNVPLWGGDLSRAREVFVTLCLVGRARRPILRSGARPGNRVFVTGTPGAAAVALAARRRNRGRPPRADERAHLDPTPRIEFARRLERGRLATAMIDVSDGLSLDADRLARASGVALELSGAKSGTLSTSSDDFELLFCVAPKNIEAVLAAARQTGTPLSEIGRVVRGEGIFRLKDGKKRRLAPVGYDHFSR